MTTDQDITIACAELMGWKPATLGGAQIIGCEKPDGTWLTSPNTRDSYEKTLLRFCPPFTNDLNAAMTLCDALKAEGFRCNMNNASDGWRATFVNQGVYSCDDPSLARAICVAFLKKEGRWKE